MVDISVFSTKKKFYLEPFITGLPYGKPSLEMEGFCSVLFFFFFRVGKSLACLSPGKWYLCAFCAYFLRIERVLELRRFLWWT